MSKNGSTPVIEEQDRIELQRLPRAYAEIPVTGITPLIAHRWSEKAKRMMLDAQQGRPTTKEPKDPVADFEACRYRLDDGTDGFPATAFKTAVADAARHFDKSLTIVRVKASLFIEGVVCKNGDELVPLLADPPTMREDMVRVGSGTADIRYRPQYWPWSAVLRIRYLPHLITEESLVALVDAAGNGGIGEWRPSSPKGKSGNYGRFEVAG